MNKGVALLNSWSVWDWTVGSDGEWRVTISHGEDREKGAETTEESRRWIDMSRPGSIAVGTPNRREARFIDSLS